jgi:hypothetical protein
MRVTVTSDLHGYLPEIEPTDLLIICGDVSPLKIQRDAYAMKEWFNGKFKEWIEKVPCGHVKMVPGNHKK